ncbi:MAG: Flp pilus assembly complex ATPase component TadA [Verrucomicrobia bacterium]|nr:Flp pilus assembly complex ATPase component TadA [Verrucomicrobiota bacterium]
MAANDEYVIEILRDLGLVSHDQIEAGRALAAKDAKLKGVVPALIKLGHVTEMKVTQALANQFGMDVITLADQKIADEVIQSVPRHVARRYKIVPVFKVDNTLTVALANPMDVDTLDSLRYILKCNVEGMVATETDIDKALAHYYGGAEESVQRMLGEIGQEITEGEISLRGGLEEGAGATEADAPIIKLVTAMIVNAVKMRASDIHVEPLERKLRVRYRIDGYLHEIENPPKRLQPSIISRLKIMSNMSIAEKRIAQDGRIKIRVGEKDLDLRVSDIPTAHGESIVMRILDKSSLQLGLPQLGFFSDDQATFEQLIKLPDGILLVTGPTGSGKTTTLYACLNFINRPDKKLITVEDPVEYVLAGVNQVEVKEEVGLTFAAALRSMLRQAPNVILIGEIRDMETAEIAINASLTGHLVFSTLHTNDAPSAITRLIDIGVKPFLCASSIRAIMAQRLVRRICSRCKEPYAPTDAELRFMGLTDAQAASAQFSRGRGCNECSQTGFRGRCGIYEIFVINDKIREMIYKREPANFLRKAARELGMRTLREDGIRKVLAGVSTPEEVITTTVMDLD